MKKGNQLSELRYWVLGLVCCSFVSVFAESVTNNLDLRTNLVVNSGNVPAGDLGLTFTNPAIRGILISAGQLSGVDPETGEVITNAANLLSLKAESLMTASNITAGGTFVGDGSGLTNLNASYLSSGILDAGVLPTNGTWNAAGVTVENLSLQDLIADLSTLTNLTLNNETLSAVISNLQQQVTGTYITQSSIKVQVTTDEALNGQNLLDAYAQAKTLNPSVSNRIAVIVPPGRYNLSTNGLTLDTGYIDLIGLTTDREAQYLYGTPGESNGVVRQTEVDSMFKPLSAPFKLCRIGSGSCSLIPPPGEG